MAELALPLPIAYTPLERMLAAVDVDGNYRRFSGIQRPSPTDPSTTTETYDYSEGEEELAGTTTPGNVTLVFTHVPEGLIDTFLKGAVNSQITVRFITRGSAVPSYSLTSARLVVAQAEDSDGYEKGLMRLEGEGATWEDDLISAAVREGKIREQQLIEFFSDPAATPPPSGLTADELEQFQNFDLAVIEQPIPDSASPDPGYKLYVRDLDISNADLAILNTGLAKDAGRFHIRHPSTIWQVQGTLLSYSPQFDLAARTARIEMTRGVEVDKNIRYENAHKAFTQYAGASPFTL